MQYNSLHCISTTKPLYRKTDTTSFNVWIRTSAVLIQSIDRPTDSHSKLINFEVFVFFIKKVGYAVQRSVYIIHFFYSTLKIFAKTIIDHDHSAQTHVWEAFLSDRPPEAPYGLPQTQRIHIPTTSQFPHAFHSPGVRRVIVR